MQLVASGDTPAALAGRLALARAGQRVAWAAAGAACVILIVIGVVGSYPRGNDLGDFGAFVASGLAVREGRDPYGKYRTVPSMRGDLPISAPNLNPPISLFPFEVLARFDPLDSARFLYGATMGLYALAVALLLRGGGFRPSGLFLGWVWSLGPFWYTLDQLQVYVLLLLLAVGAWLALRRQRPALAGALIGTLVAIKLNFLVWPVLLFLGGFRRAALAAAGAAALLSVLPAVVYGPGVYARWLAAAPPQAQMALPSNASLLGLAARLGAPWLGAAAGGALLLAVAVWAWRARPAIDALSGVALAAALLASPLAWPGYALVLLPIFFVPRWTVGHMLAAVWFAAPVEVVFLLAADSPWLPGAAGALYTAALAVLLVPLIATGRRQSRRAGAEPAPIAVAA